ncbi:MAG: acetoacetate--CoA ligase [Betaproteobacteria bacterium]|nr:acetoacetate--CoA ligase [Betaproteobacteria bacterium]
MADRPLWSPSTERAGATRLAAFVADIQRRYGRELPDYAALHRWSVARPDEFWAAVWDFCQVIASERGHAVVEDGERMPGARWFPGARLNYARNLLRRRDDSDALVFWGEDRVRRRIGHGELYRRVACLAAAMRAEGVGPGDRIAAYMPNMPETLIAMLAAASIGAVFTSASPDFGVQGVLDRFGQVEPKLLFVADGYDYSGKTIDSLDRVREIAQRLPSLRAVVVARYTPREGHDISGIPGGVMLPSFVDPWRGQTEIEFEQLPFDHPLYILYSSGTTGVPKCIVHGAGGVLLQHLKEHQLHADVRPDDRLFYFTTCGWMMWNWLMSGLASGATLLLYDGSPFAGRGRVLFDFAEAEGMTHFGTSAKYLDAAVKLGLEPARTHDLSALRSVLSTGSPLSPEGFEYVYRSIKADVQLASISGGTDLVSCFVLGNPMLPVWPGEIQCAGLGMAVDVFNETGQAVRGEKGELVCTRPFPVMPLGFWNDAHGSRYRAAYFERFPGVWCHGDFAERTAHDGFIIYGRSDATLNPGGVRIGTAEIYRQVETLPEVLESLVIGQTWDDDVRVVLFIKLREGLTLDAGLTERIRRTIRDNASPRHVPAKVIQVTDIPRTRSGKIVELAVRAVIHGEEVKNVEALANPEALEQFRNRPELRV